MMVERPACAAVARHGRSHLHRAVDAHLAAVAEGSVGQPVDDAMTEASSGTGRMFAEGSGDRADAATRATDRPARPKSASGGWTGIAGLAGAVAAIVLFRDWLAPGWLKTLAVLGIAALAMIAVDSGIYRTYRNPTTGLALVPLRPFDVLRVGQKLVGFWLTCGAVGAAYLILPEYGAPLYAPFRSAILWLLPAVLVLSPFYIAFVDRRQREPVDAYAQVAMLLAGQRPADWSVLAHHARGWLVKGFFLPLMFVYTDEALANLWAMQGLPPLDRFDLIFSRLIDSFYLIDVLIASIGYGLSLRIFDNHLRSAEPTLGGWVVCLICYHPFWTGSVSRFFSYELDGQAWGVVFAPYPVVYVAWGSAILILVAVYMAATVSFGLRFSNLTNRGIITNGPYRWFKHPAYICKCLSFWMIAVPFIAGAGWWVAVQSCIVLGGANAIYWLRAKTEERHLSADPAYREYQAFMRVHGLLPTLGRMLRGRRR